MLSQIQKNVVFRLIEAIVTSIVLLIQYAILAKYLSYNDFGIYSVGMLWSFIIITASYSFSLPIVLSRELCQRNQPEQIVTNIFLSQFVLGLLTLVLTLPCFLFLDYFQDFNNFGFLLFISGSLLLAAPITMQGILISQERMRAITLIRILAFILNFLAIYLIVLLGLSLQWIFASHFILAVTFAYSFYCFSRAGSFLKLKSINLKEIKYNLLEAGPIVLMSIATQLYCRIDIIMIDMLQGKEQVAVYTAAYKLLEYLLIICSAVVLSIFPNIMKIAHDLPRFKQFYKNLIKFVVCSLFPIALIIAIMANPIISLIYGEAYQMAASTLQILMLAGCVSFLNSPSSTIFIAYKNQKAYLIATILSLLVNVIGNYLLIPIYGYLGAAIATLLTELFMLGFCLVYIHKLIKFIPFYSKP